MANERGGDRRQGRPGGGGHRDFRPRRSAPPRAGGPRGGPPRPGFSDEGPRDFAPRQGRPPYAQRPGGYPPRTGPDEGGMAIRVDPRRRLPSWRPRSVNAGATSRLAPGSPSTPPRSTVASRIRSIGRGSTAPRAGSASRTSAPASVWISVL